MTNDDFITAGTPHLIVTLGSVAGALAGLFVALTGAQLLGARFIAAWMNLGCFFFIGVGVAMIPAAFQTYRGVFPAAVGMIILSTIGFLVMAGWCVLTCGSVFSLMNLLAIPVSALATLLVGLGLPKVKLMSDAKRRLAEQGFSLGL